MTNLNCKKMSILGLAVVLATMFWGSRAAAQSLLEPPQRWLLIFDTSTTMKNWLPATTTEVQNVFISSMSGRLHEGDSVAVWTFDKKLRTGEYPVFSWVPSLAASEASDLVSFLNKAHYLNSTRFAALAPALKQVIAHSQRLTIVIFSDGMDDMKLTPYDPDINQAFKQLKEARKKLKSPFVVVVRTQEGQFVGATLNLPPGGLDFPSFPPLPSEMAPVPTTVPPVVTAPAAPVVTAPPLVIVGTNVITDTNELKKATGP